MPTITAHIIVRDAARAADWYARTLDAEIGARIRVPDGRYMQIELRLGDSRLMIADEFPEMGAVSPQTLGGTYGSLTVAVDDADAAWQRALDAGAEVFRELEDTLGRAPRAVHPPLRPPLGCGAATRGDRARGGRPTRNGRSWAGTRRTGSRSSTLVRWCFGAVLDSTGSWGLGVVEADDEDELRAFAAGDPVVTTGTAEIEVGKVLAGFVRPR